MIVHVVAAEIGECRSIDDNTVEAELVEAVARGLQRKMIDTVVLQFRKQAMNLDRIGRRVPERPFACRRYHADRAEARGRDAQRSPYLTHERNDRRLTLRASDGCHCL